MSHIFISYSHKDAKYVHKLQKALQEEGFDVWIDDRIDYGTEWPKVIQKQLDVCDAFVVVLTENAYKSKWVQNEVARAGRKGKPFFPLLLQGDPWLSVEATQYVDISDGSLPSEKFYKQLSGVTPRKQAVPFSSLHTPVRKRSKTNVGPKIAFLILIGAAITVVVYISFSRLISFFNQMEFWHY